MVKGPQDERIFSQNFLGEDPQTPRLGSSKLPIIASQLVKVKNESNAPPTSA